MKNTLVWVMLIYIIFPSLPIYSQDINNFFYSAEYFGILNKTDKFSFAIIADPQVKADKNGPMQNKTLLQNAVNLKNTIQEINQMKELPAFTIVAGDMIGSPTKYAFDYYRSLTNKSKIPVINIHGNHEGGSEYDNFINYLAKPVNNLTTAYFSFDVGKWHLVAIPCEMNQKYFEHQFLPWLQQDLSLNKDKNCMVFLHEPLLPIGLTQLESYTYPMYQRKLILKELINHGKIKYVFCGHVHTGIKSSIKTSWTYKGINFIDCPTGTWSRNFGEEFKTFHEGYKNGGYYLIVNVNGDKLDITARCNNVDQGYLYPKNFKKYKPDFEPRWEKPIAKWKPYKTVKNGNFEDNRKHWFFPYRYYSDSIPGFEAKIIQSDNFERGRSLQIITREKGSRWAADELMELYQLIDVGNIKSPVLQVEYKPVNIPGDGGVYIKIAGIKDNELKFLMVLDNANNKYNSINFPRSTYWSILGEKSPASILYKLGKEKIAMFGELEGKCGEWHNISVDLEKSYDRLQGKNMFKNLGVDKILIAIGSWAGSSFERAYSSVCFDNISLKERKDIQINISPYPLVFNTEYGGRIVNKQ